MNDDNNNLDQVYGSENPEATKEAYEKWAIGYDAENIGNGYRVPSAEYWLFDDFPACGENRWSYI